MPIQPLKILIVDDSALFRKVLRNVLEGDQRFAVVGVARNGKEALELVESQEPDALILDVEMPVMDGLKTLKAIRGNAHPPEAIMFSSHTQAGAEVTLQALELGAFDFVAKPVAESPAQGMETVRKDLIPKLTFLHTRKTLRQVSAERIPGRPKPEAPVGKPETPPRLSTAIQRLAARPARSIKRRVVAIGISTGGPRALAEMMAGLPAELDAGILIVQHMPPVFTQTLAQRLNEVSPIETREARDGDLVTAGLALVAPGGRHMVTSGGGKSRSPVHVKLNDDPPLHSCRPSADVLFQSVADVYGPEAVGVIMTGMGFDGADGLRIMRDKGAYVIAQNEETCTVYGMPKRVVEEGLAEEVLPLGDISASIARVISWKGARRS